MSEPKKSEVDRLIDEWNKTDPKVNTEAAEAVYEAHRAVQDAMSGLVGRCVHLDCLNRQSVPTDDAGKRSMVAYLTAAIGGVKSQARRYVEKIDAMDALCKEHGVTVVDVSMTKKNGDPSGSPQ